MTDTNTPDQPISSLEGAFEAMREALESFVAWHEDDNDCRPPVEKARAALLQALGTDK